MRLDRQKYQESRGVSPRTVLWALVALNILLGIVAFVFPEEGIAITKQIGLKFPGRSEVFSVHYKQERVVDVDSVLQGVRPLEYEQDTVSGELMAKLTAAAENFFHYDSSAGKWVVNHKRSILNAACLKPFFQALIQETDSQLVRVVHYGDSQLEGDRITDYLRNRLQQLFGGRGPGLVLPLEPTAGARRTALVSQSLNMKKHAVYVKGSSPPSRYYGLGGASFEIQGFYEKVIGYDTTISEKTDPEDSIAYLDTLITPLFETVDQNTAFLQVYNAKRSYERVRGYDRVRLLYSAEAPFGIVYRADTFAEKRVLPAARFGVASWDLPAKRRLRIDFLQGEFPLLFGLALDGTTGVAVDNFPMRGSSDIGFTRADSALYSQQLKEMNVRLVILQYGVNVIPYVVSDYSYYKRRLIKEIHRLKQAHPGVCVLVVGPSDMSRNKGGEYASYPNIPLVRDAMKAAAMSTGSAFWDLYEAMGGENSMVAWVEKGYANKDYTHYSNKGARYVGEMLFEALIGQMAEMDLIASGNTGTPQADKALKTKQ